MNTKIVGALAFLAGAAVGSVVTWKVVKTKYDQIIQEEINSVKAVFSIGETKTEEEKSRSNRD